MNTKTLLVALISLIVGVGGTALVMSDRDGMPMDGSRNKVAEGMMDKKVGSMHGAMGNMMVGLDGKSGDALDKAFLTEMIVHHQGAVEMAQAIIARGNHPELKGMAEVIVTAQTLEIKQMQEWQKAWYSGE